MSIIWVPGVKRAPGHSFMEIRYLVYILCMMFPPGYRQPRRAGVYLLATDGSIPAHSTTYMEAACSIEDDVKLHPFAFRVHTHQHGKT